MKNLVRTQISIALLVMGLAIAGCSEPTTQNSASANPTSNQVQVQPSPNADSTWRRATEAEEDEIWSYILNSPQGIAALNQLAIERFISPTCPKTFYINEEFGGFQSLMRVTCPEERGTSIALGYDEIRIILNRFESNIESFKVERVHAEMTPEISLPD